MSTEFKRRRYVRPGKLPYTEEQVIEGAAMFARVEALISSLPQGTLGTEPVSNEPVLPPRRMKRKEAAKYLGFGITKFRGLVREGQIQLTKDGMCEVRELDRWADERGWIRTRQ